MNTNKLEISIVGLASLIVNVIYYQVYQSPSVKFYEAPLDVKILFFALVVVTNVLFFKFAKSLNSTVEPRF